MTELELLERIKLEEDTLSCLPFEPQYKMRRLELTKLVNLHRGILLDGHRSPGSRRLGRWGGQRLSDNYSCAVTDWDYDCRASLGALSAGGRDEVKVLVVESEPIVALLLRLVLENRGYLVRDVASSAGAGFESSRWAPDVIVTELPLTHSAGVAFVALLRAVVGTRGLVIGIARNQCQVAGVDALFTRPVEAEGVAEKVASLLSERDSPANSVSR